MSASQTRQRAREDLSGKWGKAALTFLVYGLLTGLISTVLPIIPIVGPIAQLLINIPISFGLIATLMKLKRGEETTYLEFFNNGFSNFAQSWKVTLWTFVKLILPLILMAVSYVIIAVGIAIALQSSPYASSITSSTSISSEQLANYLEASQPNTASTITMLLGFITLIASTLWLVIKSYSYKTVLFILFDNPDMEAKAIVEKSASIMKGNRWKYFCLELSFIGWAILAALTCGIGSLWLFPYMLVAQVVFYETLVEKNSEASE